MSVLDVDWHEIFAVMNISYPRPYRERLLALPRQTTGVLDATSDRFTQPYKFVGKDGGPDIEMIVGALRGHHVMYELLLIAVPDPSVLSADDQARVRDALVEHVIYLVRRMDPHCLMEFVESVLPVWFVSFEIVEEAMPKIMRGPYFDVIPYSMSEVSDAARMRGLFQEHFPGEVDELMEELSHVGEWFFLWGHFRRWKTFPRKMRR